MKKEKIESNSCLLCDTLWFQDAVAANKAEKKSMVWKDPEGYVYRAGYKIPVETDAVFLFYLLLYSQERDYSTEITLTRDQILKDCDLASSETWYNRFEESLDCWKMVNINFKGKFYDGKLYSRINFGIIDFWKINNTTGEVYVRLSPEFLTMMRGKGFFKHMSFHELKKIKPTFNLSL